MSKIVKMSFVMVVFLLLQGAIVSTSYAAPPAGGWGGDGGGCGSYHKVQYGETVFSISRQYGVHPYRIVEANNLYDPDHIYAGQILYIPCPGSQPMPPPDGGQCCKPQPKPPHHGSPCCKPQVGYGYDFTGYYYETYYPNYRRYSYTCGYHYNCY